MTYPSLRVVSGPSVIKERIADLYAARRRGDGAGFANGFAEDGVFHIVGDTRLIPEAGPRSGRKAIRKVIEDCCRNYEYVDAMIVDLVVDIHLAAVRQHVTLRVAATGAVGEFDVIDIIQFRDGEIAELAQFMDTASLAVLAGRV